MHNSTFADMRQKSFKQDMNSIGEFFCVDQLSFILEFYPMKISWSFIQ